MSLVHSLLPTSSIHMRYLLYFLAIMCLWACKPQQDHEIKVDYWHAYDETDELAANKEHPNRRMRYKLIQSKYQDKDEVWKGINEDLADFSEADYQQLKPLVLEKTIPELQAAVNEGSLSYENLTKFYLYRIRKIESDSTRTLHSILALNPDVVKEARQRDAALKNRMAKHLIFGMPILLKDNINTANMPTTAGAVALQDHQPQEDAFIVKRLKENGALILGKVNLSEWAYYFCSGCPVGYSALGGQTLNPYGRMQFESGGSSSGSGTTVAANYAVAAVGTETAGSILSPSSQNSVVGLKPTIGTLSRTGIVPISSTLDTPGPMTKNVIDNAIFLSAMLGRDEQDMASTNVGGHFNYRTGVFDGVSLEGKKLGVINTLLQDSIYAATIDMLKENGAEVIAFDPPEVSLQGFLTLLNLDMKQDLPKYLRTFKTDNVTVEGVADVVRFNFEDTLQRAPYGQGIFEGILEDSTSTEDFLKIKEHLHQNGKRFFEEAMSAHQLDAVLSINNYHAAYAAVAKFPCLTIPMGYKESGEPISLTFIGQPFSEPSLLKMGHAFEQLTKVRKIPKAYH